MKLNKRRFLGGFAGAAAGVSALGFARAVGAQGSTRTFGIVPQQSAAELARVWIPVFNVLSERSGLALRFATAPDIPTFERRLADGQYDFAYMNPYHYTVFSQKPGYRAIARERDRRLKGIVVVRKDSPLKSMAELSGMELAYPAPAAFAATVLVRAELQRQGIATQVRFVGSHESVYLNVAKGVHAAGGGIQRTLETMEPTVRDGLRVLWSTKDYTPHAVAAHPRVPVPEVEAMLAAMLALDAEPRGRLALQGIGFRGLVRAADSDWDDVRALGIKTLASLLAA